MIDNYPKPERRPVQIAADADGGCFALASDGTLWHYILPTQGDSYWVLVKALPQEAVS